MALLCGRAGRLTAENGGLRPGQGERAQRAHDERGGVGGRDGFRAQGRAGARDALPPRPPQCNAVLTGGDVQRIVAPLREKVDAMQKQIEKYKDRERTLVEANEVLQQSALRKECR